jgi:hypothetical protein
VPVEIHTKLFYITDCTFNTGVKRFDVRVKSQMCTIKRKGAIGNERSVFAVGNIQIKSLLMANLLTRQYAITENLQAATELKRQKSSRCECICYLGPFLPSLQSDPVITSTTAFSISYEQAQQ